ncbi:unnamed protein product [Auanema sp. JU1783]|nr:unnamed protein product [Auanema sp. JU1783]
MIPKSTFDSIQQTENLTENEFTSLNFLSPGSAKKAGKWDTQGLQDDGIWVVSASFTIFTMTSGFGLLESGRVSSKDQVNIMVKNIVYVVFGGLSYWMFGYGLSFGSSEALANPYVGIGDFFFDPEGLDENQEGWTYASFIYQLSCATTTSAIVSAGMAERVYLKSYIVVSFIVTLMHSVPAHWVWSESGVLYNIGVIDFAGCSVVHLVGGVAGLVATIYLKPRTHRFGENGQKRMSNPTNSLLGTFMLWWGWLALNAGSTYGVSHGKWRLGSRSVICTVLASMGGGLSALVLSSLFEKQVRIDMMIDGLLAALVSSTACCSCLEPWLAMVVGAIAALLALASYPILERAKIDDPVGIVPVHVIGAVWGMISTGIFARDDPFNFEVTRKQNGILYGGGFSLLWSQLTAVGTISIWACLVAFITLYVLQRSPLGLRLSRYEEELGSDLREHGIRGQYVAQYQTEKKLKPKTVANVMMIMMKWKQKAKTRSSRRKAYETQNIWSSDMELTHRSHAVPCSDIISYPSQ